MGRQPGTGFTYEDLLATPEDGIRREIIDGELFVTASPVIRHQRVVTELTAILLDYARRTGGLALAGPADVYFTDTDVVAPDVIFVAAENMTRVEERRIVGPPDLVIEVSSPSTRRTDLVRKRALYERFGVPEYWFGDLDADAIEVYRLERGSYRSPTVLSRGDPLNSPLLPALSISVDEVIG